MAVRGELVEPRPSTGSGRTEHAPPSPCVSLCQLNRDRVCRGCGRHVNEIADWAYATPARKHEILRAARERLARMGGAPVHDAPETR